MSKAMTREQFIEKWLARDPGIPDWFIEQFQYNGFREPTEFWCPHHGAYTTTPYRILHSTALYSTPGCTDCIKNVRRENMNAALVEAHERRNRHRVAELAERRKRIIAARQPNFVSRARKGSRKS